MDKAMKLKNYLVLDKLFIESINYFLKVPIPITVTFMLDKCLDVMSKELEKIEKHKLEIYKKYATISQNEKGDAIYDIQQTSEENKMNFKKDMEELLNIEFEIPIENKFEINVSKVSNFDISYEYFNKLKNIIDFKN